jgi:xylose dehydrogenase (NAD/NADP)
MKVQRRKLLLPNRNVKKLKWGVAGCGWFAEHTFLSNLQQVKKSELVSTYSSKIKRANFIANKFNAESGYSDYKEFLSSDIDVVYVASKNIDHSWQVIKAAEAGKHILCEKPLAITSKEATKMLDACKSNKVLLSLNYVYRFHPLVAKAKELIDQKVIGKIVSITTNFNIDYAPNENFRFNKKLSGGGALRDLGTHMIDLLRFFGGKINHINGNTANIVYKSEVEDFANGIVRFDSSGFGYFNVSYNAKKHFNRIEILGYEGCISIDNMVGRKNESSKLTIQLSGEAKKAFRKKANNQLILIKSVQKSFLNNTKPKVTGEDGLLNLQLMEKLERNES